MDNAQHQTHKHHITPLWVYLAVAATLLVMTVVTIAAAHIDFNKMTGFSSMNFVIAMIIATFKASLVALIFMHLIYDNKFYLLALVSGVGCLIIFIILTMSDTHFRGEVNPIEARPIIEQTAPEMFIGKPSEHDASAKPTNH